MPSVDLSDLRKIHDVLVRATTHHMNRDSANAELHLAAEVRYSPLTTSLRAELDRLGRIIEESAGHK